MVAIAIGVLAAVASGASAVAVFRLVRRDGYGPVRTLPSYDTRLPSL